MVASCPDADLHILIPTLVTDATVTQIATTIRDNLPVGRRVMPEYMGEHWNDFYSSTYVARCFSNLARDRRESRKASLTTIIPTGRPRFTRFSSTYSMRWTSTATPIGVARSFVASASGLRAEARRSWRTPTPITLDIPVNPIGIDAVLVARYPDNDDDITIASVAASTYSNYAGSIQYKSKTPWSMGMFHDLYRHYLRFNTNLLTSNQQELANASAFILPAGQTVEPALWCYEASMQTVVPSPTSYTDWVIRPSILYDFAYHPYCYDTQSAFLSALQVTGIIAAAVQ